MKAFNAVIDTILKLQHYNLYPQDEDDDINTMELNYAKTDKRTDRMRVSAEARLVLQQITEQFISTELMMSCFQMTHAKRVTLYNVDLRSVARVST